VRAVLDAVLPRLDDHRARLAAVAAGARGRWRPESVEAFAAARTYSLLHAAAATVLVWLHNRHRLPDGLADGAWLALCLQRLLQRLDPTVTLADDLVVALAGTLHGYVDADRLLSLDPITLYRRPA
jgi:hypothetical protein